jgi:hypothetical protein
MVFEETVFDFGFTAVHEDELESVQAAANSSALAVTTQTKLDALYKAILPLLDNLKKNPEKDYIFWPKRMDKIKAFETMIKQIYKA